MRRNDLLKRVVDTLEREGRLRPECLVEDSRSPKHPLHKEFRWGRGEDAKLAMEARLDIARRIFTSVRVTYKTTTETITSVALVRDRSLPSRQQGYVSVVRLRDERDLARETIAAEVEIIKAAIERCRELAMALELVEDFDELLRSALRLQHRSRRGSSTYEEDDIRPTP